MPCDGCAARCPPGAEPCRRGGAAARRRASHRARGARPGTRCPRCQPPGTRSRAMPMIRVELFPGRSADQKRRFAKAVTDSFVEICGSTPEAVHVVFVEVAKDDWAIAGRLASDAAPAKP
ncbi:MAG: tautomerase family protein [Alphaproteobacteria bacterium]